MNENDIVNEWLQIAYEDYDSAQYLYDNKRPRPLELIQQLFAAQKET